MACAVTLLPCYWKLILNATCIQSNLSGVGVEMGKGSGNFKQLSLKKQQNW